TGTWSRANSDLWSASSTAAGADPRGVAILDSNQGPLPYQTQGCTSPKRVESAPRRAGQEPALAERSSGTVWSRMGMGMRAMLRRAVLLLGVALAAACPASASAAASSGPCTTAPAGGGDWPSYGHDAANTRTQP